MTVPQTIPRKPRRSSNSSRLPPQLAKSRDELNELTKSCHPETKKHIHELRMSLCLNNTAITTTQQEESRDSQDFAFLLMDATGDNKEAVIEAACACVRADPAFGQLMRKRVRDGPSVIKRQQSRVTTRLLIKSNGIYLTGVKVGINARCPSDVRQVPSSYKPINAVARQRGMECSE